MKKRITAVILAAVLAVTTLTGCSSSMSGKDAAVTVNGIDVTADIAEFYARYIQAGYETYYAAYMGNDMWGSRAEKGNNYEDAVKEQVIEDLETMLLSEEHMKEYKVTLSQAEKDVIEKSAREFDEDNALHNKNQVSGERKTVKRLLTLMAVESKVKKAVEDKADVKVTNEEAKQKRMQYVLFPYKETKETGKGLELSAAEKRQAKADAEAFLEHAKEKKDFEKAAQDAGKIYKEVTFDSASIKPDKKLVKAADKLSKGDLTDVVETEEGCYVAKLVSLKDRKATADKKKKLIAQRKNKIYEQTKDEWLMEADISIHKRVWRSISYADLGVRIKQKEEKPYTEHMKTDDQTNTDVDY